MKLTDTIHLLQIDFEIDLGNGNKLSRFVNVILVLGDTITLIDTGVKGSEEAVYDYLRSLNREPSEIASVVLSHAHPDHIGSAAAIKEITGCRVYAHELEREWIEDIDLQCRQRPVPGFYGLVDRPVVVDETLAGGQVMKIKGGPDLRFIHSPGHSKGSLNIAFEEDRILFTADSVPLKNDIPNYDSYPHLMASLAAVKAGTGYTTLLTSWTPPLTGRHQIDELLAEGEGYMKRIDAAVKTCYSGHDAAGLDACQRTAGLLGQPPFMVNPIVDQAFRSHLSPGGPVISAAAAKAPTTEQ